MASNHPDPAIRMSGRERVSPRGQAAIASRRSLLVGALAVLTMTLGATARAATITVNSLADTGSPRICVLRDAITAANTKTAMHRCVAGTGNDTIQFGVIGTILLGSTLPTVTGTLNINGPTSTLITISGGDKVQVMQVASNAILNLNNLTIAHGSAESGAAGGIVNQGTLFITDSTLSDNSAGPEGSAGLVGGIFNQGILTVSKSTFSDDNGGAFGDGGIHNDGTLTVVNSTFSGNTNGTDGGGTGGLSNFGKLTVTNSAFSGNLGGGDGAIHNSGTATITKSTFSGNRAGIDVGNGGGGVGNEGALTITDCTFFGNIADLDGGGIQNSAELTITNSTFSGNSATISAGGAIANIFVSNPLFPIKLTVTNSTFSGNSTGENTDGGAGIAVFPGTVASIKSTILTASSNGGNCASSFPPGPGLGTIIDAGYNISDDSTCGFAKTGSANNGDNVDPSLSPAGLADNGGPTQTIALQSGSPAIDAIPVADCTDQSSPPKRITTDQRGRGFARPDALEAVCDIGAYESAY